MNTSTSGKPPISFWLLAALWALCLFGLAIRVWLSDRMYPMTGGDPLYSYTYRATLIAAGHWEGVFLMWHPPGYPLLMASITAMMGSQIPPYWVGVGISLGSYLGLFWIIDRLVARRAHFSGTRLVTGSFIALYETLLIWSASPLTEPIYLLTLYLAVLLLDRDRISSMATFFGGVLLGLAFTIRLEAAAPTAGIVVYLAARAYRTGGWRAAFLSICTFTAGWLVSAGWLIVQVDYLRACKAAQTESYTFPPAGGLASQMVRLAECAYHAATVWLPFAVLIPYWVLIGAGLTHRTTSPGRPNLHLLLLAVVLPSLLAVSLSIMHKRTASFLLPATAIWVGLGAEVLAHRWSGNSRRSVALILALVIAGNALQAARIGFSMRKLEPFRQISDYVAAEILRDSGAESGPVWAFGSEPDIYALRGWEIVYPFFDRDKHYNRAYSDHVGDPESFVAELRRQGFEYLTFVIAPTPRTANGSKELQLFSMYGTFPERADLERIVADSPRFGLKLLSAKPADNGQTLVYVYRLH